MSALPDNPIKPSWRERSRRWLRNSTELVVAILLALLFFVLLLLLLSKLFPTGPGLNELLRPGASREDAERFSRALTVISGGRATDLLSGQEPVAVLTDVRNEVKARRARSITWERAVEGMPLYDSDVIQTFGKAGSVIAFDAKNQLKLGANSLVVIHKLKQDLLHRDDRVFQIALTGELYGRLAAVGNNPLQVEVKTPSAVTRIQSASATQDAEFKIRVNPDRTSTIEVIQGTAEIISASGTQIVAANHSATLAAPPIAASESPLLTAPPVRVLAAPPKPIPPLQPKTPAADKIYVFRDLSPRIEFAWNDVATVERNTTYRITIARDTGLADIVYEGPVESTTFTHGNLKAGDYYWRVRREGGEALRHGDSMLRHFTVMQDRVPPLLRVTLPPAVIRADHYQLQGVTEPGATVFVGDAAVAVDGVGNFSMELKLKQGLNVIVIEAVDLAGNTTYTSRVVTGNY